MGSGYEPLISPELLKSEVIRTCLHCIGKGLEAHTVDDCGAQLPLSEVSHKTIKRGRVEAAKIIAGTDKRLLVL